MPWVMPHLINLKNISSNDVCNQYLLMFVWFLEMEYFLDIEIPLVWLTNDGDVRSSILFVSPSNMISLPKKNAISKV